MGSTCYPEAEVHRFMNLVMSKQWQGREYDMLERNCCSFAEALCQYLVGRAVPNWVTRFPRAASSARRGVKRLVDVADLVNDRLQMPHCGVEDMTAVFLGRERTESLMDEFDEEEITLDADSRPRLVHSFLSTISTEAVRARHHGHAMMPLAAAL
eukprot:Skav206477  [mRNA]  locus=scaffold1672:362772:363236:- [translate_table: standard]